MTLFFYISGHGFGHASRDIELINAIAERRPETQFVVRTSVVPWLFATAHPPIDVQAVKTDTGLTQIDSLTFDEAASATDARRFYQDFDRRVADEAKVLHTGHASVVVGDIPPLAFAAAERAGVPSVAVGNFTWDWIYSAYRAFDAVGPIIRDAYAKTSAALRLPFHGGFGPMAGRTIDVPLIARRSGRAPVDTRRSLGIPDGKALVLASFGAYGAKIPYDVVTRSPAFTFISLDEQAAQGLASKDLAAKGLTYQDVVAAADVVVSKPGYGIVSECIANDTALLYTSRSEFPEYDVFVEQMPRVLRCRYISPADLLAGRWEVGVAAVLAQEPPPERWRVDGADVAADAIISR